MKLEEFDQLYRNNAESLFAFLVYQSGDRGLAEDVLADAFERAFRARKRFDERRGNAKTWLYSIALNRLRDVQRRSVRESTALEASTAADGDEASFADRIGDRDELRVALLALPDEEREVLALRFGGDLTVPEIAQLLEQPLSRIEGRVYRGLRKLRERLGVTAPRRP